MAEFFREARRRLLERKESLRRLTAALDREAAGAEAEAAGKRLESSVQGVLFARLSERDRRELVEIDAALARLDAGTYGRCETCGRAVGRQRLIAIPQARLCLDCSSGSTAGV